jgi:hypothetical protein
VTFAFQFTLRQLSVADEFNVNRVYSANLCAGCSVSRDLTNRRPVLCTLHRQDLTNVVVAESAFHSYVLWARTNGNIALTTDQPRVYTWQSNTIVIALILVSKYNSYGGCVAAVLQWNSHTVATCRHTLPHYHLITRSTERSRISKKLSQKGLKDYSLYNMCDW